MLACSWTHTLSRPSTTMLPALRVATAQAPRATAAVAVRTMASSRSDLVSPPPQLPHCTLRTGSRMPMIGMGTFTGTRFHPQHPEGTMERTAVSWLKNGGRMFDCAQNYLNEAEIGDALGKCMKEGWVKRNDVWLTTKLNNPYHRKEHVRPALEKSLFDLGVDQVDLFLMHWPTAFKYVPFDPKVRGFPFEYEPDQCSKVTGIKWDQIPKGTWPPPHLDMGVTIHETWAAMVECWKAGLAKNIGVCNFKVTLLHELLCGTDVVPHVVQCESHPYNQQWGLIDYCKKNRIQFQAYSPLGYGAFARPDEPTVLKNETLKKIGDKYGKSIAAVCLQWTTQRGVATIPFSLKENELKENLQVGTWKLDESDMAEIRKLDKNYHYLRPENWYGLHLWD